jgi:PAS domain S-box-containing protein
VAWLEERRQQMLNDRADNGSAAAVAEPISQVRSREAEHKRASELENLVGKLGEAEASYRALVEQLPAIVYTAEFGSNGAWRYVSPRIESILGFSPEDWLANPEYWFRQLHPEDRDRVLAEELLSAESGDGFLSEYRLLTRDGQTRWLRDEAVVVRDDAGVPLFLQGVIYDITDRRRAGDEVRSLNAELEQRVVERTSQLEAANQSLRTSEQRTRSIIELANDAFIGMDASGTITGWNRQAEATFGWLRDEAVGQLVADTIIPSRYREAHGRGLANFLATGEGPVLNTRIELNALHRDGHEFPVELTVSVLRGKATVGFNAFVHDISERKRAEESLVQAKGEAERANHAKSEFLSRMSHELRTPLNAILGFGQLLEMDPDGAHAHENVQSILRGGRLLLELVNELLDIARIESGKTVLSLGPVCVKDALQEVMILVRPLATDRGVRLESRASEAANRNVLADPQRLRQVLLNLLSNAIKYNREGGVVTVGGVEIVGDRLHIPISDEGAGIAEGDLERLFTPFERLGVERTGVEGTGLGLAVSKSLVEAMGGSISARSAPGNGSTFVVELTLVRDSEDR